MPFRHEGTMNGETITALGEINAAFGRPHIVLVRAVQVSSEWPSQWDAWDADGAYWRLHFEDDTGTASTGSPLQVQVEFDSSTEWLGSRITLEDFCDYAWITWAPEARTETGQQP